MINLTITKQEKEALVTKIQTYFEDELSQEIGNFEAEFLLDFLTEHLGPYYYNQALTDANKVITRSVQNITDAIYEIEQPIS